MREGTADLAQLRKFGLEFGQRSLQHFPMARILHRFQFVKDPLAGEHEPLLLAALANFFWGQWTLRGACRQRSLGLLLLDRLGFPSPGHTSL